MIGRCVEVRGRVEHKFGVYRQSSRVHLLVVSFTHRGEGSNEPRTLGMCVQAIMHVSHRLSDPFKNTTKNSTCDAPTTPF